jgi:hypothetical protein
LVLEVQGLTAPQSPVQTEFLRALDPITALVAAVDKPSMPQWLLDLLAARVAVLLNKPRQQAAAERVVKEITVAHIPARVLAVAVVVVLVLLVVLLFQTRAALVVRAWLIHTQDRVLPVRVEAVEAVLQLAALVVVAAAALAAAVLVRQPRGRLTRAAVAVAATT